MTEDIPDTGVSIANPKTRYLIWTGVVAGLFSVVVSGLIGTTGLILSGVANVLVAVGILADIIRFRDLNLNVTLWMALSFPGSLLFWLVGFVYLWLREQTRNQHERDEVKAELRKRGYDI